jgi:hypothetical protein
MDYENSSLVGDIEAMTTRYAVFTTISYFRHRFVVPLEEGETLESLQHRVTAGDFEEFSQKHLQETVVDATECSEKKMLSLFDSDNEYLSSWDQDKKLAWVKGLRGRSM